MFFDPTIKSPILHTCNPLFFNKKIATTQDLLASWQPQNMVEVNYKQYYGRLSGTPNLQGLLNLAQQCPLSNGAVVNYARTLYNSLTHKNVVFANNCESKIACAILPETPSVVLYPNPAKNSVKVNCENASNIDIINIQGQTLVSKKVSSVSNTINTNNLPAGIYLVVLLPALTNWFYLN